MTSLEDSILRTVLYADVFNFPLTADEIHHYLIHPVPTSFASVERALAQSERLQQLMSCVDGYFMCAGRESLAQLRSERESASDALWGKALRYGAWLARLPFVRMVALTGALAVRNATPNDDIDYVIVTADRRVWLARALAIIIVRLARLRGVYLCPNYVLSEQALAQERQNLYIAHEISQMIPLSGHEVYLRMRHANSWVKGHLANADAPLYPTNMDRDVAKMQRLKQVVEQFLGGWLGDVLEDWERERKLRRFAPSITHSSSAQLDAQKVKGHFSDHGHPALAAYHERLHAHGIAVDA
jgi:hypothetical protein